LPVSRNKVKTVGLKGVSIQLSKTPVLLKAIYVTRRGEIDDKMEIINGLNDNDQDRFPVHGEEPQQITYINSYCHLGLRVVFKGTTARYIIVYEDN